MKDAPTPRPNKRPRLGPSPSEPSQVKEKISQRSKMASTSETDAQFEEFAKAIRPRTQKGPSWANDGPVLQTNSAHIAPSPSGPSKLPMSSSDNPSDPVTKEPKADGLSDMDWLKRHTLPELDVNTGDQDRLYEQSDEDTVDDVNLPMVCHRLYLVSTSNSE